MSLSENELRELRRLTNQLFDEELLPAERERLNAWIKSDPAAREAYLKLAALHGGLEHDLGTHAPGSVGAAVPVAPTASARSGPRWVWPWLGYGLAAGLAVTATLLVQRVTEIGAPAVPSAGPDGFREYVATVASVERAVWDGPRQWGAGERLPAGRLRLTQGSSWINFDSGAQLQLRAPAELSIDSPGSARLLQGGVVGYAPKEAVGFRVSTPQGTVVDLGTEFLLDVRTNGETDCRVLSGQVEWHSAAPGRAVTLLSEGEGRRYFSHGDGAPIGVTPGDRSRPPAPTPAAAGELLAYEPFNYTAGLRPAETAAGGSGWPSPWRGRFIVTDEVDVDPQMRVREHSLLHPSLVAPAGGHFAFHEERQWRLRALPRAVDFSREGVYYLSFLVLRPGGFEPDPRRRARLQIDFRNSTDYWSHWIGFALTADGTPFIIADGNNTRSERRFDEERTLFVVAKIATSAHGADQLFMKVYAPEDSVDEMECPLWTVASRQVDLAGAMDLVIAGSMGGVQWNLDEFRFGTSWAAVVPVRGAASRPGGGERQR
jgi:ferric-dicitrate binding protein FerR (iron transport regulator)